MAGTGNILMPAQAESLRIQAKGVYASQLLKSSKTGATPQEQEASTYLIMLCAAELGLHPALTANRIYIVNGNLSMPTELMQALAERSGVVDWKVEEGVDGDVEYQGRSYQNHFAEVTMWRVDKPQRKRADRWDLRRGIQSGYALDRSGLKGPWLANGPRMPFCRAFSTNMRYIAPDVLMGMYSVEEMGYQEDDLRGRNLQDPEAPIGAQKAAELNRRLTALPDAANVKELVRKFRAENWGSPEFRFESVPQKDLFMLEAWVEQQEQAIGKRIGVKQGERARTVAIQALQKAGRTETEAVEFLREYYAECGIDRAAEMTSAQESSLAARIKVAVANADAIDGDFEPDPPQSPTEAPATQQEPLVAQEQAIDVTKHFPQGDATTEGVWRTACKQHGLNVGDVQMAAIGDVRELTPDDMPALLAETCRRIDAQMAQQTGEAPTEGLFREDE